MHLELAFVETKRQRCIVISIFSVCQFWNQSGKKNVYTSRLNIERLVISLCLKSCVPMKFHYYDPGMVSVGGIMVFEFANREPRFALSDRFVFT